MNTTEQDILVLKKELNRIGDNKLRRKIEAFLDHYIETEFDLLELSHRVDIISERLVEIRYKLSLLGVSNMAFISMDNVELVRRAKKNEGTQYYREINKTIKELFKKYGQLK